VSLRRTAVITGAALGIGQEYATRLAADGIRVILADIEDATQTLDLITAAGGDAESVRCDVTSQSDIDQLHDRVDALGGAGILVHNAGIYPFAPFAEIDLASWRRVQAINVEALFLLCQAFVPGMRARGWGRIVGISSGMFSSGIPGAVHYVASKGAIVGFVRGLAGEVGPDGITVNAIAPGLIRSRGTTVGPHDSLGMFESVIAHQDIKRTGLPADLAGALAFLVSDEASFMTGQTIVIDGGVARA
jgi:3-oxoacyl-[acyl-carrier protein] reductase